MVVVPSSSILPSYSIREFFTFWRLSEAADWSWVSGAAPSSSSPSSPVESATDESDSR